jgi:PKD repeat protein
MAPLILALLPGVASAANAEAGGPYVVLAGDEVTLDASNSSLSLECFIADFLDPPLEGLEFRWDFDGDTALWEIDWTADEQVAFDAAAVDGPASVEVTLEARCNYYTFSAGWIFSTDTSTATISVANVPPTVAPDIAVSGDPAALVAGVTYDFSVAAEDVEPADVLSYAWTWSDGVVTTGNPTSRALSDGTVTVDVVVSDDDGGTASTNGSFTATDALPSFDTLTVPAEIPEGGALDVAATASDPAGDPVTITWTFPDGTEAVGETASWDPPGEGSYTILVTADDGANVVEETRLVDVVNADPVFDAVPVPDPVLEGDPALLQAPATDPGGDTLTWHWDYGDGSTPETTGGPTTSHAWRQDDGVYEVEVTVSDGDGGSAVTIIEVTVVNRDPRITSVQVPSQVLEGELTTLAATAQDVSGDPLTYTWDLGDGTTLVGSTIQHSWTSGAYTVHLDVTDGDGGSAQRDLLVTVTNTAPVATDLTVPPNLVEGTEATMTISVSDAGNDAYTVDWDFGDGGTAEGEDVTHTWADDGQYDCTVTVTDALMAATVYNFQANVSNADPVITSTTLPDTGNEGDTLQFVAAATDPGADTVTLTWFLDGSQVGTGPTVDLTFDDDAVSTLRVEATDEDGGSAVASTDVTIGNVDPVATLTGDTDDGVEPVLSWTIDIVDPGADTFTHRWDFGDGTLAVTNFPVAEHTYAANGTYTVRIEVEDDDGGIGSDQLQVTIDSIGPATPVITLPPSAEEGRFAALSCAADDLGGSGSVSYSWDFGDGTGGTGPTVSHTYVDDGRYEVTCTATDAAGLTSESTSEVLVDNVAPTPSGTPLASTVEGASWDFTPGFFDPGTADVPSYSLVGPANAAVDPASGLVTFSPAWGQIGDFPFELNVSDGDGGTDVLTWEVEVLLRDDDGDGLSDAWENDNGLDPTDPTDAADDPDGDGRTNLDEYVWDTDPFVDDRPAAPILGSPTAGERVDNDRPLLAAGPDGEGVTQLDFEVFADAALTQPITGAVGIPLTGPGTVWRVDVDLTENADFWWTARAFDGFGYGPWAAPEAFRVDAIDEPPSAPVLSLPMDNATVPTETPTLSWSAVTDPDGDDVTYEVEIDQGAAPSLVIGGLTDTSWVLDPPAVDLSTVCWTVTAVDSGGLRSTAPMMWCFTVDLGNEAPTPPVILRPQDGEVVERYNPIVQVENGVDPEGRPVQLHFEVSADPSFPPEATQADEVPADPSGRTSWVPVELEEDTWYTLRALASDGDVSSDWVETTFFVNVVNAPPTAPTLLNPEDGTTWSNEMLLEAIEPEDPEGFDVEVGFTVWDQADTIVVESPRLRATDGLVSWAPGPLPRGTLRWSARAWDRQGDVGPYAEERTFEVPADDAVVNTRVIPEPSRTEVLPLGCADGCRTGGSPSAAWWVLFLLPWMRRRR